ncbi:MAG TPA: permease prefix domain 1-containing protein, partial [Acidobacteriaceae bacterium]
MSASRYSGIFRLASCRLLALFRSRRADDELDEELQAHLELAIEENLRRGLSAAEARREALRSFGGVTQIRERYREQRGVLIMEQLGRDLRFGLRQLYKSPGFALTAILTLALGVGANTAIFTLIDSILLRPLPFPGQERLVSITADGFFPKGWIRALEQNAQSFSS